MSRLNAMMEQYKENATPSKPQNQTTKFDKNNYFGTKLDNGVNSTQKKVRILEPKGETESPFVEVYGHKKQVDGSWATFICPKHEKGERCPFCEARDLLLAEGDKDSKKEAAQYSAKKMYVVKLIDREHPEHGVKFWRFNHHYKNAGTFDKINGAFSVLPQDQDPFSTTDGRDMIISITRDGKNSIVSSVNFDFNQSPLSSNAEEAASWKASADEMGWENVYSIKPYDFLEIIVRGGSPIWQKNENGEGGKWIDKTALETDSNSEPKEDFDSELTMGSNQTATSGGQGNVATGTSNSIPESAAPSTETAVDTETEDYGDDEEDDDLPF